jgi:hypothetical protein
MKKKFWCVSTFDAFDLFKRYIDPKLDARNKIYAQPENGR